MFSAWKWALFILCALSLFITTGAARPFAGVPEGDIAYSQLELLSESGLLSDFILPEGELSRLEVAVLIQQAMTYYGQHRLNDGEPDSVVEDALTGLLTDFADELGQVAAPAMLPSQPVLSESLELERRISYLESEVEEMDVDANESYLDQFCDGCEECEDEDCIEIQMYGDFYLQADGSFESDTTGNNTDHGDFHLYWGELGWDVSCEDWSGRFAVLWDDENHEVDMYEAWAKWQPGGNWFGQLGHLLLPFGDNAYYFPTYPAVNDLSFTQGHAIGAGYESDNFDFMAHLYNPMVEVDTSKDNFSDFSIVTTLTKQEADECQDGWQLTAGYISHLAQHDLQLAGEGPVADRVGAYNLFGRYDWGGNRYHLLADYTAAAEEYVQSDIDADGDGNGDQPSALNMEFVYEPVTDTLYAISYQVTDELADYADNRIALMYGERINQMVMMKVEYSHGEYGDFATANQDTDDRFIVEINLAF